MVRPNLATYAVVLSMLAFCVERASAEMGPCVPVIFDLICGSGDGAARAIVKTISPSRRLAFAWQLTNKPPGNIPEQDDPALENLIVRLDDGTALAKSHGSYWDLRLLVKIEQRAQSASAEIFSFTEDDATTGPFNLVKVIEPALQAKMPKANTGNSTVAFSAHPATTIDDQGLLHTVVSVIQEDGTEGPRYAAVVQVMRSTNAIDAKVVSVMPFDGISISITVH